MKTKQALQGLGALAHEGRLNLFRRLVRAGPRGMAAGDVARATGVNFTTASAQLAQLANAGLIESRRNGRSVVYSADYATIRGLMAFLLKDCCQERPEILAPLSEMAQRAAQADERQGRLL